MNQILLNDESLDSWADKYCRYKKAMKKIYRIRLINFNKIQNSK